MRGRKPKPDFLRVVKPATHGRRPQRGEAEPILGEIKKPSHLKGRAAELWSEVLATAPWIGPSDVWKLAFWCVLQSQVEEMGRATLPSVIAQWRGLGTDLGLDPVARMRMPSPREAQSNDPTARYLANTG